MKVSNGRLVALVLLLGVIAWYGASGNVEGGQDKVCVRHKEDGVPDKIIEVAPSAVKAHVNNHGDSVVACEVEALPTALPAATSIPLPTATPIQPTALPTPIPVVTTVNVVIPPTITSIAPTATPVVEKVSECVPDGECSACDLVIQALNDGKVVIIANENDVTVLGDGEQIVISGAPLTASR